jgi:hypothetical protein
VIFHAAKTVGYLGLQVYDVLSFWLRPDPPFFRPDRPRLPGIADYPGGSGFNRNSSPTGPSVGRDETSPADGEAARCCGPVAVEGPASPAPASARGAGQPNVVAQLGLAYLAMSSYAATRETALARAFWGEQAETVRTAMDAFK